MLFKCKMCGGNLEFEADATVGVCDSCGTKQTLPKIDSERRANLYDRANHFRRNNEFDKASGLYEQILAEDKTDAEAYWSLVLCRYGIEYVEDPATNKRIPTVNRAQYTSVYDDENYKSALQYADRFQKDLYEEEANSINEIQKGILEISQKEDPFDVFICYKETDDNGRRTQDSVLATDLYHQLTKEGYKVFFSRITLEDKIGTAYEPYIFAALNSAKVMVVLGTKAEYFNSVWVKNEWSRYLALVKESDGKKVLIPAYRDMDPYDLPEEFSHLQAQDMSKLGFMQDLIHGINKIVRKEEEKASVNKATETNVSSLLKRVFLFLEDGNYNDADKYCERVLDQDPENAEAYLGKLMSDQKVTKIEELSHGSLPFDNNGNYLKILRFGDDGLISKLQGYNSLIKERNEKNRIETLYNTAIKEMETANSEQAYIHAADLFNSVINYNDAASLAQNCLEEAEKCRQRDEETKKLEEQKRVESVYQEAVEMMNKASNEAEYSEAAQMFNSIMEYRDSASLKQKCYQEAEQWNIREKEKQEKELQRVKKETGIQEEKVRKLYAALDYVQDKSHLDQVHEKLLSYKLAVNEAAVNKKVAETINRIQREETNRVVSKKAKDNLIMLSIIVPLAFIMVFGALFWLKGLLILIPCLIVLAVLFWFKIIPAIKFKKGISMLKKGFRYGEVIDLLSVETAEQFLLGKFEYLSYCNIIRRLAYGEEVAYSEFQSNLKSIKRIRTTEISEELAKTVNVYSSRKYKNEKGMVFSICDDGQIAGMKTELMINYNGKAFGLAGIGLDTLQYMYDANEDSFFNRESEFVRC